LLDIARNSLRKRNGEIRKGKKHVIQEGIKLASVLLIIVFVNPSFALTSVNI